MHEDEDDIRVGDIYLLRGGRIRRFMGPYVYTSHTGERFESLVFESVSGGGRGYFAAGDVIRAFCLDHDSEWLETRACQAMARGLIDDAEDARKALQELHEKHMSS